MPCKTIKIAAVTCAAVLSAATMFGCAAVSKTPEGPAATSASVQARSQSAIEATAATLDKQSDNDAMGQKNGAESVSLGQTVQGDGYTFEFTDYAYRDRFYAGAEGESAEYGENPGHKFLTVSGTYTNTSDHAENIRKGTAAWFTFGGVFEDAAEDGFGTYGIQGWTDAIDADGHNFSNYIVEPGETVSFFVYAEVPDTVSEQAASASFLWGFNDDLDDAHYEASTEGAVYQVSVY